MVLWFYESSPAIRLGSRLEKLKLCAFSCKSLFLHLRKAIWEISCAVPAQLISFLVTKLRTSRHLLWLYTPNWVWHVHFELSNICFLTMPLIYRLGSSNNPVNVNQSRWSACVIVGAKYTFTKHPIFLIRNLQKQHEIWLTLHDWLCSFSCFRLLILFHPPVWLNNVQRLRSSPLFLSVFLYSCVPLLLLKLLEKVVVIYTTAGTHSI